MAQGYRTRATYDVILYRTAMIIAIENNKFEWLQLYIASMFQESVGKVESDYKWFAITYISCHEKNTEYEYDS